MHDDNTSKEYGLGMVTSSTVWNVTSMDPLNFTITYYNGDQYDNRNLYVTLMHVELGIVLNMPI